MIRPLTFNDLEECYELSSKALETHWTLEMYEEGFKSGDMGIVYEENNEVQAYLLIRTNPWEFEILEIVVCEKQRHRGIGTQLLEAIILIMKEHKITDLFLEVSEENKEALSFYKKHEFKEISRRQNYYGYKAAIVMKRVIE